jgi:hypothetical protein
MIARSKQEPSDLGGASPLDKERSEFHVLASIAESPVTGSSEAYAANHTGRNALRDW